MRTKECFKRRFRNQDGGAMIVIIAAVTAGIVIAILVFGLSATRFIGSHQEQVTANQSAALKAAEDISRIVVEDPYFGLICLSDYPPKGTDILAQDNYAVPVTGINTLLATVRLDMIIADRMRDNTIKTLALRDYQAAMSAKTLLVTELKKVIDQNQPGKDIDGNVVTPYADALAMYNSNPVRLTEGPSTLVPGTFKLSLGCIQDLTTNTAIPAPSNYAALAQSQQVNGFYKAYTNASYNNRDFVFAGVSDATKLVDHTKFQTDVPTVPYVIPTIIRCEAIQEFQTKDNVGRISRRQVLSVAAAEPGSLNQRRPSPGAFAVNFPYGKVPEINSLLTLLTHTQISKAPTDLSRTALGGDFPASPLSELQIPIFDSTHPPFGHMLRLALYDWIRRAGPSLNVDSLLTALNEPISDAGSGQIHLFQVQSDGTVAQVVQATNPIPVFPVSNNQIYAVSGLGINSANGKVYDIFLRDYVYQPGRSKGGIHAGEPLPLAGMAAGAAGSTAGNTIEENPLNFGRFPSGTGGSVVRPTYDTMGIAVEVRFRLRT